MNLPVRALIALAAVLALPACGGGDGETPEAALKALVAAANDADDKKVAELICPEAHEGGSIAGIQARAAEADPALDDFGYALEAGGVSDKTDTTATGSITVEVKGTDDASPAGDDFLNQAGAPPPLTLIGENGDIALVKRDNKWVACE